MELTNEEKEFYRIAQKDYPNDHLIIIALERGIKFFTKLISIYTSLKIKLQLKIQELEDKNNGIS